MQSRDDSVSHFELTSDVLVQRFPAVPKHWSLPGRNGMQNTKNTQSKGHWCLHHTPHAIVRRLTLIAQQPCKTSTLGNDPRFSKLQIIFLPTQHFVLGHYRLNKKVGLIWELPKHKTKYVYTYSLSYCDSAERLAMASWFGVRLASFKGRQDLRFKQQWCCPGNTSQPLKKCLSVNNPSNCSFQF